MVNVTVDGKALAVAEGSTILQAAAQAGIAIPTLCYFADLNDIGACRVCVVEVRGEDRLAAACNTAVREGMEVVTESEAIAEARHGAAPAALPARPQLRLLLPKRHLQAAGAASGVRRGRA